MSIEEFKRLGIEDKALFDRFFREDPPRISEMTFTNLFMWRHKYRPTWKVEEGCLLILFQNGEDGVCGLQPLGKGDKARALERLCEEIGKVSEDVRICRVDEEFVRAHVDAGRFTCLPDRGNSDYVYLTQDLIHLPGNKYHRKKNHFNQFLKRYAFEYKPMDGSLVDGVLALQESWCAMRECALNPALSDEDWAVREALARFEHLGYAGGVILIDSRIEAFSIGEALNQDTAVIHFEKANSRIQGAYAAINQMFCKASWAAFPFVNREQDMGVEGLRQAKESYFPHHLVNKFTLIPKG